MRLLLSHLFPYTTLFRSQNRDGINGLLGEGPYNAPLATHNRTQLLLTRQVQLMLLVTGQIMQHIKSTLVNKGALASHIRSEEHTSELQSSGHLVCRLLLE